MSERYTYEVRPHLPIKELIPGRVIKRPCTTKLTKEEALICMKYGPVYRVFPGKSPIRVFGSNIDQLHTPSFNTAKISSLVSNNTQNDDLNARAQEGVSNEPKTEVITEANVDENQDTSETEKIEEVEEKIKIPTYSDHETSPADEAIQEDIDKALLDLHEEKKEEVITEEDPVEEESDDTEEESEEEDLTDTEPLPEITRPDHTQVIKVNTNNNYHKKNRRH